MPAMSPTGSWFEVGDQVRNPSLVYGADVEEGSEGGMGMGRVESNEKKWYKFSSKKGA